MFSIKILLGSLNDVVPTMISNGRRIGCTVRTEFAAIRFLSRVDSDMSLECRASVWFVFTKRTSVGTFSSVDSNVNLQSTARPASISAKVTSIGSFSRVDAHVTFERRSGGCTVVTMKTRKWTPTCMNCKMFEKVFFAMAWFFARRPRTCK